jgi:hypothetical protein
MSHSAVILWKTPLSSIFRKPQKGRRELRADNANASEEDNVVKDECDPRKSI